jgi:hypothetical protein
MMVTIKAQREAAARDKAWRAQYQAKLDADGMEKVSGALQLLSGQALRAVLMGEIDLTALARQEFGDRGYDLTGAWVGFEASKRIAATTFPVRGAKGKTTMVTVPDAE